MILPDVENLTEAAGELPHDKAQAQDSAEQHDQGLYHARPNHGFHATRNRIKRDKESPAEDDPFDGRTGEKLQRQRHQEQNLRDADRLQENKAERAVHPGRCSKAVAQIFEGRRQA